MKDFQWRPISFFGSSYLIQGTMKLGSTKSTSELVHRTRFNGGCGGCCKERRTFDRSFLLFREGKKRRGWTFFFLLRRGVVASLNQFLCHKSHERYSTWFTLKRKKNEGFKAAWWYDRHYERFKFPAGRKAPSVDARDFIVVFHNWPPKISLSFKFIFLQWGCIFLFSSSRAVYT